MHYLTGEDVLVIHFEIIEKTGGSQGMRDVGLFLSVVEKPKTSFGGKEMYRGVFQKAAVYLEAFARYHVFVDGNKRIALASSARFLFLNGYKLSVSNRVAEEFVLKIVTKKLSLAIIRSWLKKYSKLLEK